MGKSRDQIRREITAIRARLAETIDALAYKADVPARAIDRANEIVRDVAGSAGENFAKIRSGTNDVRTAFEERAQDLRSGAETTASTLALKTETLAHTVSLDAAAQRRPLAIALAALVAGALAGTVLPRSRLEDRLLGANASIARGRLRDHVRETARGAGDDLFDAAVGGGPRGGAR